MTQAQRVASLARSWTLVILFGALVGVAMVEILSWWVLGEWGAFTLWGLW